MPWTRKLKTPIQLSNNRRLQTLADARALILSLPDRHQANAHGQHAGELLIGASRGRKVSIDEVTAQLSRALKAEGLI